jgi:hypothetical protein
MYATAAPRRKYAFGVRPPQNDGRRLGDRAMTLGLQLKRVLRLFDEGRPPPSAGGGALSDLSRVLTDSAVSVQLRCVIESSI